MIDTLRKTYEDRTGITKRRAVTAAEERTDAKERSEKKPSMYDRQLAFNDRHNGGVMEFDQPRGLRGHRQKGFHEDSGQSSTPMFHVKAGYAAEAINSGRTDGQMNPAVQENKMKNDERRQEERTRYEASKAGQQKRREKEEEQYVKAEKVSDERGKKWMAGTLEKDDLYAHVTRRTPSKNTGHQAR